MKNYVLLFVALVLITAAISELVVFGDQLEEWLISSVLISFSGVIFFISGRTISSNVKTNP